MTQSLAGFTGSMGSPLFPWPLFSSLYSWSSKAAVLSLVSVSGSAWVIAQDWFAAELTHVLLLRTLLMGERDTWGGTM